MDLHFGIFLQQEAKTKQNFLVTVDFWQNYMHYTEIVGKKENFARQVQGNEIKQVQNNSCFLVFTVKYSQENFMSS